MEGRERRGQPGFSPRMGKNDWDIKTFVGGGGDEGISDEETCVCVGLMLVVTILMVLGSIPNGAGTMVLLFLVHFLLTVRGIAVGRC